MINQEQARQIALQERSISNSTLQEFMNKLDIAIRDASKKGKLEITYNLRDLPEGTFHLVNRDLWLLGFATNVTHTEYIISW